MGSLLLQHPPPLFPRDFSLIKYIYTHLNKQKTASRFFDLRESVQMISIIMISEVCNSYYRKQKVNKNHLQFIYWEFLFPVCSTQVTSYFCKAERFHGCVFCPTVTDLSCNFQCSIWSAYFFILRVKKKNFSSVFASNNSFHV